MAWNTGPHAEAPEGSICYPTEEHNIMTWFTPDDAPPARSADPPPKAADPGIAPAAHPAPNKGAAHG